MYVGFLIKIFKAHYDFYWYAFGRIRLKLLGFKHGSTVSAQRTVVCGR